MLRKKIQKTGGLQEWKTVSKQPMSERLPVTVCPRCGHSEPDHDGFGMLYCDKCGYCEHASVNFGICGFCGATVAVDKKGTVNGTLVKR